MKRVSQNWTANSYHLYQIIYHVCLCTVSLEQVHEVISTSGKDSQRCYLVTDRHKHTTLERRHKSPQKIQPVHIHLPNETNILSCRSEGAFWHSLCIFLMLETGFKVKYFHFGPAEIRTAMHTWTYETERHTITEEDMSVWEDSERRTGKRQAVTKRKWAGKTERGGKTHKMTGAQTGRGRSQSEAYTNTNDYKDRQVDWEAGRQVIKWVRQRQARRRIVKSACFCSPQEAWHSRSRSKPCVYVHIHTLRDLSNILSPSRRSKHLWIYKNNHQQHAKVHLNLELTIKFNQ